MRDCRLWSAVLALVTAVACSPGLSAQGLGYASPTHTFDVEAIASLDPANGGVLNGNLGCVWFQGNYYFTSSNNNTPAFNHRVIQFDSTGTYVGGFDQDAAVQGGGSVWGYRDGATDAVYANDGSGTLLMPESVMLWGNELGIFVHDATGALATTYQCANGTFPLPANPIPNTNGILTTLRAVAYDPHGNAGNGSIWTADFGSDILELDMSGNVLTQVFFVQPGQTNQWSAYGFAIDPYTGQMWVNSSPNAGNIVQLDKVGGTFAETGASFKYAESTPAGGIQGGLDMMVDNAIYPSPTGNAANLVGLTQDAPDVLAAYRLHLYSNLLGETENRLVTQVTTIDPCLGPTPGPRDGTTKSYQLGDTLTWGWDTTPNPANIGLPAMSLLCIDTGGIITDASTDASTLGDIVPELTIPNALSVPAAVSPFLLGDTTGVGTLLATSVPLWPGFTVGAADLNIPIGAGFGSNAGDNLSMQVLAAEPNAPLGFIATNRVNLLGQGALPVASLVCEATGANPFNADTSNGFWRVRHTGLLAPIVQIDVTLPAGAVWDTDQGGMADAFWGGNSTLVGTCGGTYRNASDVACGLIYDDQCTYGPTSVTGLAVGCDAAANCGFIGNPPSTTSNNYTSLTFRFAPNMFTCLTFEWDTDTDGIATPGAAHAGTIFTITLQDGTVHTITLAADPADPNRAFGSI